MNPEYIVKLGNNGGLSILDILLLGLCPLCGALGTLVAVALKTISEPPPTFEADTELPISNRSGDGKLTPEEELKRHNYERRRFFASYLHRRRSIMTRNMAFVGLALGILISLYFVGAITSSVTSLARVLALSILLGYQAPNIWFSQEKIVKKLIDEKLKKALDDKTEERA